MSAAFEWFSQRETCFSPRNKSVLFGTRAIFTSKKLSICTTISSKAPPVVTFPQLSPKYPPELFCGSEDSPGLPPTLLVRVPQTPPV